MRISMPKVQDCDVSIDIHDIKTVIIYGPDARSLKSRLDNLALATASAPNRPGSFFLDLEQFFGPFKTLETGGSNAAQLQAIYQEIVRAYFEDITRKELAQAS